ncbi:MAG: hypothetical protein Q9209_002547 [Squamulea sp. 1 TL-2023]
MPAVVDTTLNPARRKRQATESGLHSKKKSRKVEGDVSRSANVEEEILLLEGEITQSRKHYNKIAILLDYCKKYRTQGKISITAAVALCRVFLRLMALGSMIHHRDAPDTESIVVRWLQTQLISYKDTLQTILQGPNPGMQSTALTLLMRLLKAESCSFEDTHTKYSRNTVSYYRLLESITSSNSQESAREEFVRKYVQPYDDVRHYTIVSLNHLIKEKDLLLEGDERSLDKLDVIISILALLDPSTAEKKTMENFYQEDISNTINNIKNHRKLAQELWLNILRCPLSKVQRKSILGLMTTHVAPWFTRPELLMDFLTDSYNAGGSMSLAALSGLFYLMQEKNLDYPQFFPKLYSLLTADVLHSKHRSSFFRLLDIFLSSTHLPAALVASFIKRLARLSLSAPPSGIVVVVPWIYNLLKTHPSCTFMIHKRPEFSDFVEGEGMDDPFDMTESDPMETKAIDSSLWEIHTLQSHYHPNVATIAKIISEQFTKQAYNIEDFLDHSYSSMLNAELSKEIKKPPVIEYDIPKKIFLRNPDPAQADSLMVNLWDFS